MITYYDLTGNGVEIGEMVKMEQLDASKVTGLYPTYRRGPALWVEESGHYTRIDQK